MTTQALQRAQAREQKIWPTFLYSAAFNAEQAVERATIYGLYSGCYLNMHNYLSEIEATDLDNLLSDYNSKLAELDNQETIVLNSIVAKRYLANIDVLIHDQKLETGEQKRQAEETEWDAKMEALEADRAALVTLATKLSTEEKKTEARIAELQAQIAAEETNLSLAEIEEAEKEIALAEMGLKITRSAIDIQKIQVAIVEEGVKLIETELQKQRLIVDIAETENRIARTEVMESQLDVAEASVTAARAELEAMQAELEIILSREAVIDAEIAHQASLVAHVTAMGSLKQQLLSLQTAEHMQKLEAQAEQNKTANEHRTALSQMDISHAESNRAISEADTKANSNIAAAHIAAAAALMEANIAAATEATETSIVTNLTHSIGSSGA